MNRLTLNLLAGITVLVGAWALNPSPVVFAQEEPPLQACCWLDKEENKGCCGDRCEFTETGCQACAGDACPE